jgi:hypothetical protein
MSVPTPHTADRWTVWWNRLSQVAGLGIMIFEVVRYGEHVDFVVMLFAAAMMLGGVGLRILVRGAASMMEHESEDSDK